MKEEEKNKQKTSVGESEIQTKAGDFALLLSEVKQRIQLAQTKAVLAVNSELVRLYWDIGRIINARQKQEGWGSAVIPRLARELKNELPELKGFSERNIGRMIAFYRDYPEPSSILPQPVAEIASSLLWSVPWAHHVILMDKVSDIPTRIWYMEQTLANGWSGTFLPCRSSLRHILDTARLCPIFHGHCPRINLIWYSRPSKTLTFSIFLR